jgi:hypothetical protein
MTLIKVVFTLFFATVALAYKIPGETTAYSGGGPNGGSGGGGPDPS